MGFKMAHLKEAYREMPTPILPCNRPLIALWLGAASNAAEPIVVSIKLGQAMKADTITTIGNPAGFRRMQRSSEGRIDDAMHLNTVKE
jgi:hypothetical protein